MAVLLYYFIYGSPCVCVGVGSCKVVIGDGQMSPLLFPSFSGEYCSKMAPLQLDAFLLLVSLSFS